MNYVIKQTEQFLRGLKTCHSIDQNLHCYFSNNGILFLSNYQQFEDVDTKKPTFFFYLNSNSFEQLQTNSIHYKMPQTLSPDLQIKLQKLNASLDKLVFELNILQLYTVGLFYPLLFCLFGSKFLKIFYNNSVKILRLQMILYNFVFYITIQIIYQILKKQILFKTKNVLQIQNIYSFLLKQKLRTQQTKNEIILKNPEPDSYQYCTSLKPFKKQIKKIEIQVYFTISQLRVIQKFKMIVFFKDSYFTIECPIIQLDEIEQMELIRKYMEKRRHLDVLEVDPEISEYLNDFNQKEAIQFILKRNSLEVHLNSQNQDTSLELNSGFLTSYKFDDFTNIYKNVNTINIEPNILTPFHGYGFKISISKDVNEKPRIFISKDWQDQISMVLKSITTLINKIKIISILDDECNDDDLLDIIAEYQSDGVQEQESFIQSQQIEEQQMRKKIKMNLKS